MVNYIKNVVKICVSIMLIFGVCFFGLMSGWF